MNQKFLYIATAHLHDANLHRFITAHYVDLPDGSILLSAAFHDEGRQEDWEQNVSVQPLALTGPIDAAHVAKLASLGVKNGHTSADVRTIARKIHKLM